MILGMVGAPECQGLSPADRLPEITVLTSLRFFAALVVLMSHVPEALPLPGELQKVIFQGGAGTAFFFVLSGFVLTYNYHDRLRSGSGYIRAYFVARFARIYPMYLAALLAMTALLFMGPPRHTLFAMPPQDVLGSWLVNVFLLQAFLPLDVFNFWNSVSWSISAEMFFYLTLPYFLRFVVTRVRSEHLLVLAAAFLVVEGVLFYAVAGQVIRESAGLDVKALLHQIDLATLFPVMRVWEFFIGSLLGAAFLRARAGLTPPGFRVLESRAVRDVLSLAAVVAIFLTPVIVQVTGPDVPTATPASLALFYLAFVPVSAVLIAAVSWGPTVIGNALKSPFPAFLGKISYSVYIAQMIPITIAEFAFKGHIPFWAGVLVVVAAIFLGAAVYALIETPTRTFILDRARRRRCRAGTPGDGVRPAP